MSGKPRLESLSLDACIAMRHEKNPKEHDIDELIDSIVRFGFRDFPTIDEATMIMVEGHGRCEALAKMRAQGYVAPPEIEVDGSDWRVPIHRGMSWKNAKERDAYILAHNQHTRRGGYNLDIMPEFLAGIADTEQGFKGVGFDEPELHSLGFSTEETVIAGGPDEDRFAGGGLPEEPRESTAGPTLVREIEAGDLPKKPITKLGDVWILGDHVLVCGDSLAGAVALALEHAAAAVGMVWTDPPWNVDVTAGTRAQTADKRRARGMRSIANDALGADFDQFCDNMIAMLNATIAPGVAMYLAMSASEYSTVDMKLRRNEWHWSSNVIWAKNAFVLGRKDYHSQHEAIWYGWRDGAPRCVPVADRTQGDVWFFDRPPRHEAHPTMKPIRLVARAITNSSRQGDLIGDFFGGSGSTLLAAEQLARRAALVELDPRYCDLTVERFEQLTGKKARRL
jgi:DNA modification methylase